MGSIIQKSSDLQAVINSSETLLAYFFSDRCAPCLALRLKVIDMAAKRFPKMNMVLVDSLSSPETAALHQAFSLPVLVFFVEGKEYFRYSKYISVSELEESIGRIYELFYS